MTTTARIRYVAIVHTTAAGGIDHAKILDNQKMRLHLLMGEELPPWVRERVELLQLCRVDTSVRPGSIGRRCSQTMFDLFLTSAEFRQLTSLAAAPDCLAVGEENRAIAMARAVVFKPRFGNLEFQHWMKSMLQACQTAV